MTETYIGQCPKVTVPIYFPSTEINSMIFSSKSIRIRMPPGGPKEKKHNFVTLTLGLLT